MAQEWGPEGVRANVICPGLIKTKFSQALWQDERVLRHTLARQAIRRVGEPRRWRGWRSSWRRTPRRYCTGGVHMADGGYLT
jgi:NAD(P)-dependent dehydrogenase (short-subunit alcohol dehydrogenase family)